MQPDWKTLPSNLIYIYNHVKCISREIKESKNFANLLLYEESRKQNMSSIGRCALWGLI